MRYFALILGKLIIFFLKILNRNGGSLPGKMAIQYCPDILSYFDYPDITILVTGTNGKTSTSNIIAQVFEKADYKTISNSRGDNIVNGITSLLIRNSSLNFKVKADVLVIEIDELTLAKQLKNIDASDVVITNFFRDQLDRSGEMESIILKISQALKNYKGRLFLNEDDPNVKRFASISKSFEIISFGLEKTEKAKVENLEAKEGKFCPLCLSPLEYEYYQYSHIGRYKCSKCDFKSQTPDYMAKEIDLENKIFRVGKDAFSFSISAIYHIYNLITATAVAKTYNIKRDCINEVFANFNLGIGRMENIDIKGKKVLLNLVKNPTGCNEIIKYIDSDKKDKSLIFLLNDNIADGTDTSWIWDSNFEQIKNLKMVITTGKRAYEAGLRFKLSNICKDIVVEKDVDTAIKTLISQNTHLYVISTYTGLFDIRQRLINAGK